MIAGSTHQPSLRRVGTSGPPRGAPITTGVVVGALDRRRHSTSSVPCRSGPHLVAAAVAACDPTVRLSVDTSKT